MAIKKLNGLDIVDTTKGQINGIAGLNAEGKLPANQLPIPYGTDLYLSRTTPLQYFTTWLNALDNFTVTWSEKTLSSSSVFVSVQKILPISETRILFCTNTRVYIYDTETETETPVFSSSGSSCDIATFNGEYYACIKTSSTLYLQKLVGDEWQLLYQVPDNVGAQGAYLHNIDDEYLVFAAGNIYHVWNHNNEEVLTIDCSSIVTNTAISSNCCTTDGTYLYIALNSTIYVATATEIEILATSPDCKQVELIGKNLVCAIRSPNNMDNTFYVYSLDAPTQSAKYNVRVENNNRTKLTCVGGFATYSYGTGSSFRYYAYKISTNVYTYSSTQDGIARIHYDSASFSVSSTGKFVFAIVGNTLKLWLNGDFVPIKTSTPISYVGATRDIICAVHNNKVYIGKCPALL